MEIVKGVIECPVCGCIEFAIDYERNEIYCLKCGLILPLDKLIYTLIKKRKKHVRKK